MRKMKDSGVAWIGEIPEDWSITYIRYLARNYKAGPFGSSLITSNLLDNGEILVYTPEHISKQSMYDVNNLYLPRERIIEMSEYVVYENDIIFSIVGSLGRAMHITSNMPYGIINQRLAKFSLDIRKIYINFFLWIFVKSDFYNDYINLNCRGSFILNLTKKIVYNMPVPLPNGNEQKSISNYLDAKCSRIDSTIANIRTLLEKLKEYKQSVITQAVTKGLDPDAPMKDSGVPWIGEIPEDWRVLRIKQLATENNTLFMDGDWIESDVIISEGIRYLTTGNIGSLYFKEQGAGYISEDTFKSQNCLTVYPNDLAISRLNEPLGRACIIPEDFDKYVVAVDIVILRPNKNIHKRFLMYCMNVDSYNLTVKMASRGTTMPRVSRTILGNMQLPFPSFDEQNSIVSYLDAKCAQIDSQIAEQETLLTKLEAYKKSLIYECVTGKREIPASFADAS